MLAALARAAPDRRAGVLAAVPRAELWQAEPVWSRVEEAPLAQTLDDGIAASFGERVPDLVEAALEQVRAHGRADELHGVLEPVLDDEAAPLVDAVWRAMLAASVP